MAKSPSLRSVKPSAQETSSSESIFSIKSIELGTWQHNLLTGEMIWSDGLYKLFGLEPNSVQPSQKIVKSMVHPEDRVRVFSEYNLAIKNKQFLKTSCRLQLPNGETHLVQALGQTTYDVDGNPLVNYGTLQDLTDEIQKDNQLKRRTRGLFMLSQCNKALIRLKDEVELLTEICRICVMQGGYKLAWVGYAENNKEKRVKVKAQYGYEEGYLENIKITWDESKYGSGPTGTVIRTGKTSINQNILTNPKFTPWRESALKHGYQASIALPLVRDDITFGALMLYSAETDAFEAEEVAFLTDLANNISIGIESIRARERQSELEENLRSSEKSIRQAQESAQIGSWEWNSEKDELICSEMMQKLFDKKPTEIKHSISCLMESVFPDDKNRLTNCFSECIKRGEPFDIEFRIFDSGLNVRWLEAKGSPAEGVDQICKVLTGTMQDITARKKIESDLEKALLDYRFITDNSDDVIWIFDIESQKYTYISPSVQRMHGVTVEEGLQRKFTEVLTPESAQLVTGMIATKLPLFILGIHVDAITLELNQYRKDGSIVPTETTTKLARNADGKIQIIGISRNISERKRIEDELRISLQFMSGAEKQTGLASWSLDLRTGKSWWSPEMYRVFGLDPAGGVPSGEEFLHRIHPADRQMLSDTLAKLNSGEEPDQREFRTNPAILPFRILKPAYFVERDKNGKVVSFFGTQLDVTEKKKAEEELERVNTNYQLISQNTGDVIWVMDFELQKYMYISPSIQRLRGFSPEEVLNESIKQSMTEDSYRLVVKELTQGLRKFEKTGKPLSTSIQVNLLRKDGSIVPSEITATLAPDSNGKLQVVGISRDISERVKAEEELHISIETNKAILNSTQDSIYLIDPEGVIFVANLVAAARYNMDTEEIIGKNIFQLSSPQASAIRRKMVQEVLSSEKSYSGEYKADGRTYQANLYPLFDDAGKIKFISVYSRDISDKQQLVEKEKKDTEDLKFINEVNEYMNKGFSINEVTTLIQKQLLSTLSASFVEFFLPVREGKLLMMTNNSFLSFLTPEMKSMFDVGNEPVLIAHRRDGYLEQVLQKNSPALIQTSQDLKDRILDLLVRLPAKGKIYKSILRKMANQVYESDKIRSVIAMPIYGNNRPLGVLEIGSQDELTPADSERVKNMTNQIMSSFLRKRAEERLAANERRYKTIVEAMPDLLVRISTDGTILDYNAKPWHKLYAPTEAVIGKRTEEVTGLELAEKILSAVKAAREQNKMVSYEEKLEVNGELLEFETRVVSSSEDTSAVVIVRDITEQKALQREVIKGEEQYRVLMESLESVVAVVDKEGKFLFMNENAAGQIGGKVSELVGKSMFELFPPAVADVQILHIRKAFEEDKVGVFENISIVKQKPIWYRTYLVPIHDEHGKVASVLVNSTDIDDIKRSQSKLEELNKSLEELNRSLEERVRERTREYQDLYNNAPSGYHSVDSQGIFILMNDTELKWLGYEREEIIGKKRILEVLTDESKETFKKNFPRFMKSGHLNNLEMNFIRKDGTILPAVVTASAIYDAQGNYVSSRSSLVDNSERRAIEAEILRINNLSDAALEMAQAGYWYVPLDGTGMYYSSDRVCEIEGVEKKPDNLYSLKDGWEQNVRNANPILADQAAKSLENVMNGKTDHHNVVYQFKRPQDGEVIWIHALGNIVKDQTGQRIGIAGVSQNITQQKNLELALQKAKEEADAANRAKSTFLANMSHEIRTPMNAILGFTQVMLKSKNLEEKNRSYLEIINRSGEHLLTLINEVLEMSKIEAGHVSFNPTTFDLPLMLKDLKSMFDTRVQAKNLMLTVDIDPNVPKFIESDESKLKEILINLLGNAVKFTQKGGIILRCKADALKEANKFGDIRLQIEVEDTGMGIAANEIERLFQAFERSAEGTKNIEGTGLGLSISLNYARFLGGDIRVTSNPKVGSHFFVEVIVRSGNMQESETKLPARKVTGILDDVGKVKVLVVDDQPENRMVMKELLEQVGISTEIAEDGEQAVNLALTWKPDLIFMDLRMPVMNGYEAAKKIVKNPQTQDIPIVAVTASILGSDWRKVKASGMRGFVRKPYEAEDLFRIIEENLGPKFVYGEEIVNKRQVFPSQPILTRQDLQKLPTELITKMYDATIKADLDDLLKLIQQARSHSEKIADQLQELANNYQYEALLIILKEG
ncbi:MAG: PAS domain S-box protein [Anaerolineaceae bacterium]|nr:PAS domain S-box protein [Anaerolineaceae bacterium]